MEKDRKESAKKAAESRKRKKQLKRLEELCAKYEVSYEVALEFSEAFEALTSEDIVSMAKYFEK